MNDKTMPKRIWLVPSDYSERTLWTTKEVEDPDEAGQAAYIRTDLVPAPSAGEPLEDGQYRWLKIYGSWFACYIASLTRGEGNFYFLMPGYDSGFPRGDKMVEEVGPAIQPPPDQSN